MMVGLAVWSRALGAEVRVRAPPDSAERLAEVGVPLVSVGQSVRPLVHEATSPASPWTTLLRVLRGGLTRGG
jgi:vancomycin aglycone glucosyltransferase